MHHCTWYIIVENRGRPRAVHNGQVFKINETFQNQTNALKIKNNIKCGDFLWFKFHEKHKKIGF